MDQAAVADDQDQNIVEMRQIWVHGNYMGALDDTILHGALDIQNALVNGDHPQAQSANLSWALHSPLLYWRSSHAAIENDTNVTSTINRLASMLSPFNLTLDRTTLFAGTKFARRNLVAADALVITLFNRLGDSKSIEWAAKLQRLAESGTESWTIYPPDVRSVRSQYYEFQSKPLSSRENVALATAYFCMLLYVAISLRKLKAFRSKAGLVVTAITQMATSILASFTICSVLQIKLVQIPQEAYPFVVLVIGLENMFRIINALLAYPPEMLTTTRIANALADVGHLSLVTAAQNLAILWILSKVVSPGVAAFCAFAAVALLVDSFFLLTFFIAVLNVDIQRLELQDSLTRPGDIPAHRKTSPRRRTWIDALVEGRLPFSTRIAGSAVLTTFVMALNWHFFAHGDRAASFRRFLGLFRQDQTTTSDANLSTLPSINQTASPIEWLQMQDHNTAREVINMVLPDARRLMLRIFDPVVFVHTGADRAVTPVLNRDWPTVLRDFALQHCYPFAVVVVFVVAFVTVLMNFLLWDDNADDAAFLARLSEEPALIVASIHTLHKLDIIKIAGSRSGHVITVGLDGSIDVAIFDDRSKTYLQISLNKVQAASISWPVVACAVDDTSRWAAVCTATGQIHFWDTVNRSLLRSVSLELEKQDLLLFEFINGHGKDRQSPQLVLVTPNGQFVAIDAGSSSADATRRGFTPLHAAFIDRTSNEQPTINLTGKDRKYVGRRVDNVWNFHEDLASGEQFGTDKLQSTKCSRFEAVLTLEDGTNVGIRKRIVRTATKVSFPGSVVRRRNSYKGQAHSSDEEDAKWEAYVDLPSGETYSTTATLREPADEIAEGRLHVSRPGPLAMLGADTLAVALANDIQVIRFGQLRARKERNGVGDGSATSNGLVPSRRRLTARKVQ
ncbi:hypothetical protein LTR66_007196 [Elasticomyces elasticus]|nr:hypothetical protein LTR66_007196 [Elasticomyces elasticus]